MANVNATKGLKREWLSIITASVKTNIRAHNWLVKSGAHYVEHGDTSLIVWAMDNAWSSGMKRESMVRWIAKHLKVKITATSPKKAKAEVTNKNRDRIDMGVASGDPFYLDIKKAEKEDKEFDLVSVRWVRPRATSRCSTRSSAATWPSSGNVTT